MSRKGNDPSGPGSSAVNWMLWSTELMWVRNSSLWALLMITHFLRLEKAWLGVRRKLVSSLKYLFCYGENLIIHYGKQNEKPSYETKVSSLSSL